MPALLELSPLLIALWAFAYAAVITLLVVGLFKLLTGPLGHIPYLGTFLSNSAKAVAQELTHLIGKAEAGVDLAVGGMFHALAGQWNWFWSEFRKHARLLGMLSPLLAELVLIVRALQGHVRDISKGINDLPHDVGKRLRELARGIDRIDHEISGVNHRISRVVMPRLRTAEGELGHLEDVVIPNLRGIAQGAENDVGKLRKWITDNIPAAGTIAFAGAVAWALTRLGLDWIKCNSASRFFNNRTCSAWNTLDDLLGLLTAILVVENFDTVVHEMQTVEEAMIGAIEDLFGLG